MLRAKSFCAASLLSCFIASKAVAQGAGVPESAPAAATRPDPRLATRDIDHPADFRPDFATRADWEKRAAFLTRQVTVANGLWPMPEKTPLARYMARKIRSPASAFPSSTTTTR